MLQPQRLLHWSGEREARAAVARRRVPPRVQPAHLPAEDGEGRRVAQILEAGTYACASVRLHRCMGPLVHW